MTTIVYYCKDCGGELLRNESPHLTDDIGQWINLDLPQHDLQKCVYNLKLRIEKLEAKAAT